MQISELYSSVNIFELGEGGSLLYVEGGGGGTRCKGHFSLVFSLFGWRLKHYVFDLNRFKSTNRLHKIYFLISTLMLGYLWCNASAMAAEQDQEELGLQNDENVQFIQHSPSEAKHHKSNNGSLNDEVCSEGTASPAKGKSTSKLFQYVRYTKTFWLFFSFIGLVS